MIIFDWLEDKFDGIQGLGAYVSLLTIVGCVVVAYVFGA